MKEIVRLLTLLAAVFLLSPISVSAAPNLVGVWKGTVKKVTANSCPAPIPVVLTLSQCLAGTAPGNLINGTMKLGTTSLKVVGKIKPDSTLYISGNNFSSTSFVFMTLNGKYIPALGAQPAMIQLDTIQSNFGAGLDTEIFDIINLKK